ncbi:MAG TPA: glycosyltransferase family 2 protein, partial [Bdellovibrionales bacterium]|nr:glycosyltransferase family 2 protein [Bdellovibrionales bacterium]
RDRTVDAALAAGARVISHTPPGYGEALRAGFKAVSFEYVAFLDADLSYPVEELPALVNELERGADLVLGNRLRGRMDQGAMPFLNRYLGTPVLSWMIRRLHRLPTYDCNSGFRVFRREVLPQLDLCSPGMELASEMLVRAGQVGLKYREVEIPFRRDQRGRPPHLRRWRDGWRHARLITGARLQKREARA